MFNKKDSTQTFMKNLFSLRKTFESRPLESWTTWTSRLKSSKSSNLSELPYKYFAKQHSSK